MLRGVQERQRLHIQHLQEKRTVVLELFRAVRQRMDAPLRGLEHNLPICAEASGKDGVQTRMAGYQLQGHGLVLPHGRLQVQVDFPVLDHAGADEGHVVLQAWVSESIHRRVHGDHRPNHTLIPLKIARRVLKRCRSVDGQLLKESASLLRHEIRNPRRTPARSSSWIAEAACSHSSLGHRAEEDVSTLSPSIKDARSCALNFQQRNLFAKEPPARAACDDCESSELLRVRWRARESLRTGGQVALNLQTQRTLRAQRAFLALFSCDTAEYHAWSTAAPGGSKRGDCERSSARP
eukprot:scaffold6_cov245-Pinguiococcus_pyrenoidosus.AAC.1